MPPPPPSPIRLLRSHSAQVNVIHFSPTDDEANERLYTGDSDGLVVVTSTRSFRALASWQAHTKGILGIEEWKSSILTHGRDNKIHVWARVIALGRLAETAAQQDLAIPECLYSLDVNALNFCRFSLLPASIAETEAYLAVPNLIESSLVDIWTLPSRQRLHAAIGKIPGPIVQDPWNTLGRGNKNTGSIMSLHLMSVPHPSSSSKAPHLRVLTAYENGGVCLWAYTKDDDAISIEGCGWEALWQVKAHVESVMALAVTSSHDFAISVSADHLLARYSLKDGLTVGVGEEDPSATQPPGRVVVHKTKYPGNGTVAIRPDGKVFAVGSWDGKIRLYSIKSFKALGTLSYHTGVCQALAFARPCTSESHADVADEDEDDFGSSERERRSRWLASGGVDKRVAIWELLTFEQK
ncbi:ASTRA complex subunit [Tulasnella sp. JGI-2019a]|nr:ASTRA complex subunit [Tulasnella sp. JGI-2019a]KAG9010439.1 ASTRA complex subunit [Tulasnella sp. JGI-2019a]